LVVRAQPLAFNRSFHAHTQNPVREQAELSWCSHLGMPTLCKKLKWAPWFGLAPEVASTAIPETFFAVTCRLFPSDSAFRQ